jgi:serine/threonine-protein kinase
MVVDSTLTPSLPSTGGIDADLQPGQVVGEYQIERKLGQGGFGAVFKGVHPLIGKQVAIKVLSQRFSVDPQMVSRFVSEARAVNQIRHHNIIDIFSFGTLEDGRFYYVMEYLDGEPLDRRLARRGPTSLAEAIPILRGVARALDAAHAKGIAHRDLKAENIFLASHPDGVFPKLLDFGIAKLMTPEDAHSHKTRTGAPMGTPHYMSPEQCHGRAVDHRTDMYAFGVLAYVMLTGVYPLDGDDYMAILMRQVHDEPEPPSSHRSDLPAGVDAAIAWLMRKDPAARPATLLEAVQALEQVAGGGTAAIPAAPIGSSDALSTLPPRGGEETPSTVPALPQSGKRAPSGAPDPSGDRTPAPASSTGAGAAARAFAVSETRGPADGSAPTAPDSRLPENRAGAGAPPGREGREGREGQRPFENLSTASLPGDGRPAGRALAERRRIAPHVLLGGGALLAAAAIVAVVAIRSGRHAEGPVPAMPDAVAVAARVGSVVVTIEGTPPNTEVRRAGELLGIAPGRVELPRSEGEVMLVLSADGYVPAKLAVVPADDLTRTVTLKPRAGGAGADIAARPAGGSGAKPAGGSGAKPAGGSGAKPAGGSGAKPGAGSDEPTNDIETFPQEAPAQPKAAPPPKPAK